MQPNAPVGSPPRSTAPTRRRFMTMALGAGGLGTLGLLRRGSADAAPAGLQEAVRTGRALGVEVSITALHEDRATAERAIDACFAELAQVERVMSIYSALSEVGRLNRDGVLDAPHPWLVQVLAASQDTAVRSGGAFDVTVQPLWELYAAAAKAGRLPDDAAVEAARRKVDWRKLEVSPRRIRLAEPGMAVTLNGIAQGFATDRVIDVLSAHGVRHALANAGELGALGRKSAGETWTVGIQHPRRPDAYIALASLNGRCMSTSGDYETTFSPDKAYNHIFDPKTGRSPTEFSSVTIVARTATEADALSTAVFVLGADKGLQLVADTPGADAFFVLKNGQTSATRGFPSVS